MFYTIFHPFDGFYEMKFGRKGNLLYVCLNIALFWISFSFLKQYVGFPFLSRDINTMNSIIDLIVLSTVFFLFCIANWSITTLFNGEGKFKDIVLMSGYSMTPLNLFFIPATLLSRVLADQEGSFYLIFVYAGILWFLFLLFSGLLTIHNYTVGKAVLTIVMTMAAAFIILFLGLLFITVFRQMAEVVKSIYIELSYRT